MMYFIGEKYLNVQKKKKKDMNKFKNIRKEFSELKRHFHFQCYAKGLV